jgi:aspartate-semialdehyde dehydrogenase
LLKRTLVGIIRSHEQTGEKARYNELKTRYYKLSKEKAWDHVLYALKNTSGYKVLHEVQNVGEIVVEKRTATGRTQDITITLFSINPVKTAIDIYSASRGSFGDLGSNYRTILEIYKIIDTAMSDYKL